MTARLVRVLRLVLVLALTAGGLAACTRTGSSPASTRSPEPAAATVNGEQIPASAIDADLADISQNEAFIEARSQQGLPFRGTQPGTFDANVIAELLDRRITAMLVRQELARRSMAPDADQIARAREDLRRQLTDPGTGQSLLDGFPERYVDEQARTQAASDLLHASEGKVALDEASLRAAYENARESFRVWCVRWIVAREPDLDAATRAAAALAAGEEFGQVAQRESAHPPSAARGGELGCHNRAGLGRLLGTRFTETVTGLTPGQISPPTQAEFGTFVVQVTDVRVRPFDEVRGTVQAQVLAPAQDAYEELLGRLRSEAEVTVAPRYGTWDRAQDGTMGVRPVGPPAGAEGPGARATRPLTRLPSGIGQRQE